MSAKDRLVDHDMVRMAEDVLLAGRYRLARSIATGGMGSVWEAEDRVLRGRVAVKVPWEALIREEGCLERFQREARAAACLSHPNVAEVLDYGEQDGMPFIVMELVEGETLAERLGRGPTALREAVRITAGVATALDAAHAAGIIHRDVKPGNIMLTGDRVKVLDFGVASASWAPHITASGVTIGTAAYFSPEQASGETATPASDVYSLGVVVYEMLAGRTPFTGENPVAVAAAQVGRMPPALRDLAPHVPEHVVRAVERALAKEPASRPPTASAFVQMLRSPDATVPVETVRLDAQTQVLASAPRTKVLPAVAVAPDESAGPARRLRRHGKAAALLAGSLILGTLALVLGLGERGTEDTGPAVNETVPATATVPDVVGLPVEEASRQLLATELVIGGIRPTDGPPGVVVSVDPRPGEVVTPGSPVTLEVGVRADPYDEGSNGERNPGRSGGRGDGPPFCDSEPDHPAC